MDVETCLLTLQAAADYHAARIARRLSFSPDDREDLRQDLLTEMIGRLRKFDAEKAAVSTFIDLLARHGAYAVVQRRRELRRLLADAISLDDETDPRARRLAETLTNEQGLGFAAGKPVDAVASVELSRDVRQIVAALAPELRSICALLQAHPTEQACRASGLSRATFYRRLRDIRLRFLVAGLAAADTRYFAATCGRVLYNDEMRALADGVLRAYRWQYILSGAQHPHFRKVLGELTDEKQTRRIQSALVTLH